MVKGTPPGADIARLAPKAKIRQYNDYGACTNALLAGQGDAVATDNGILAGIAEQHKSLHLVGGTVAVEPYGIAVEKGQVLEDSHNPKDFFEHPRNLRAQEFLSKVIYH